MPNQLLSRNRLLSLRPPAINWRWVVQMPEIQGAPPASSIVVETIEFPHFNIPALPRYTGASNRYYPGSIEISGAALSFYEDETFVVTNYLYTWKTLVVDTAGVYGMPIDYKKNISLSMYSLNDQLMFQGTLLDVWPTSFSPFTLGYGESGRQIVNCAFAVDGNLIFQGS